MGDVLIGSHMIQLIGQTPELFMFVHFVSSIVGGQHAST